MSAIFNTTMNAAQSLIQSSTCYNPTAAKLGQTFAYCLIFAVSMTGNIFIGIIVYKTKTMRKTTNFLIVNTAMSDLLFPIFLIPYRLTGWYVDSWLISGPLGQALCKLVPFLRDVTFTVSIQTLVLIAVDRFGAVVFPLRSPLISSKLCPFFILATWIVAMAIWSPYLIAHKLVELSGRLICVFRWSKGYLLSYENYVLAVIAVMFYTPLVLIAVLYTFIYLKLQTKTVPGEQSANARQQRMKRERNVLKMSIAIVLAFAICLPPYSIAWILNQFIAHLIFWSCGFRCFLSVATFMSNAHCAISPCICFIFSGNYRQALKNLVRCF